MQVRPGTAKQLQRFRHNCNLGRELTEAATMAVDIKLMNGIEEKSKKKSCAFPGTKDIEQT